jgi:hypothetical protein
LNVIVYDAGSSEGVGFGILLRVNHSPILLGTSSFAASRVTEKHYSPWSMNVSNDLEADLESAWARDPIVQAESVAKRRLGEKNELANELKMGARGWSRTEENVDDP